VRILPEENGDVRETACFRRCRAEINVKRFTLQRFLKPAHRFAYSVHAFAAPLPPSPQRRKPAGESAARPRLPMPVADASTGRFPRSWNHLAPIDGQPAVAAIGRQPGLPPEGCPEVAG
jgi:hypothetical protein